MIKCRRGLYIKYRYYDGREYNYFENYSYNVWFVI